jgi:enoyl-CoA hydratase
MNQTHPSPSLIVELEDKVLKLQLNRAEALNALDPEIVDGISQALDRYVDDPQLTCVLIEGRGRAFCAGADLKAARQRASVGAEEASRQFVARVSSLMRRIELFPAPVIAVVDGLAIAAGLEIVLACDLVLASDSSRFGDGHANFGLLPGAGGSVRLSRRIGALRAKQMMFTADLIDARTALAWGLISSVVEPSELSGARTALIAKLATKSPLGLRRMKRLVDEGLELGLEPALEHETQMSALHMNSFDRSEGLAAFTEKRRPQFLGR